MKAGEEGAGDVEGVEAHEAVGEDDGIFGGCCASVKIVSFTQPKRTASTAVAPRGPAERHPTIQHRLKQRRLHTITLSNRLKIILNRSPQLSNPRISILSQQFLLLLPLSTLLYPITASGVESFEALQGLDCSVKHYRCRPASSLCV